MNEPVIEHGNEPMQRGVRKPLFAYLLAHLPELSPDHNIFFEEHDKKEQRKLYYALENFANRRKLPIVIRSSDDGLRVWKVAK
jgi:hypothetical protein